VLRLLFAELFFEHPSGAAGGQRQKSWTEEHFVAKAGRSREELGITSENAGESSCRFNA
jgi:hypothetical protein